MSSTDLDLIKQLLARGLTDLSGEFAEAGGGELLSDLGLTVRVHYGDGAEACMRTHGNAHGAQAQLELLAPSRHPSDARTMVGEPKDFIYVHKTLVHELSMLFLWQITRRKPRGWDFFSGPAWFVDGWQEYFSLISSSEHSRNTTLPLYRERVNARWEAAPPARLDPYLDGAIILEFMYRSFRQGPMFDLLRSPETTFSEALKTRLGHDDESLFANFQQWLRE